jgi:4'-phosphopantetheinyl transferase
MELLLYSTGYPDKLLPEYFHTLVQKLPQSVQMKALRYRRWEDAYGHVFGRLLLRAALQKMKMPHNLDLIRYSDEQKPYLPEGPHFNISHSGCRVVCLVCKERSVGIDIEYIAGNTSFDEFKTQFTPSELTAIRDSVAPTEKFYQFWTAKESIIKADGRGMNIPLQRVDVNAAQTVLLDGRVWNLYQITQFEGYACHISLENASLKDGLTPVGITPVSDVNLKIYETLPAAIVVDAVPTPQTKSINLVFSG